MFPFFLLAQLQLSSPAENDSAKALPTEMQKDASILGEPITVGGTDIGGLSSNRIKYLRARDRLGKVQSFLLTQAKKDENEPQPTQVLELISDEQQYNSQENTITAKGHVQLNFGDSILVADHLRVNLRDNLAVAEGDVILKRGQQVLRGKRFEYYFSQDRGVVFEANGEIYQPSTSRDLRANLPNVTNYGLYSGLSLNDRLSLNQPLQRVTTAGGFEFVAGDTPGVEQQSETGSRSAQGGGAVNRVRFQAQRIDFDGREWTAQKIRLTNDPFSPPELEIQADRAEFRSLDPLMNEVRFANSVVVFDQTNPIPLLQNILIVDRKDREPGYLSFGFDGENRGGFYIQGNFDLVNNDSVRFTLSPQYLIQKAISPSSFPQANPTNSPECGFCSSVFGLLSNLNVKFDERFSFNGIVSLSSLELNQLGSYTRAQLELKQLIGDLAHPYDLRAQYNYRQQLFNGSLGYQTVNNSYGLLLVSPTIPLGTSQIYLNFQVSVQDIQAPTDLSYLLPANATNDLLDLVRYQGAVSLNRTFTLWLGNALPPTQEGGLKYTPVPVQPYIKLNLGLSTVDNLYSNGDNQGSLSGTVRLFGQFGNFSRPYFDYTGFDVSFTQGLVGNSSPFLFDRYVDTQVVTLGITQQIYGPIRFGIQSSYSLTAGKEISTDYFIEYSRRTYNILIRYNPILELGSINLRISDFNWNGNPGRFEGSQVQPVVQGVTR